MSFVGDRDRSLAVDAALPLRLAISLARRTPGATSAARSTTAAPSGGKVGPRAMQKEDKETREAMEEAREDSAAKVVIMARAGEVEVERLGQDRDR